MMVAISTLSRLYMWKDKANSSSAHQATVRRYDQCVQDSTWWQHIVVHESSDCTSTAAWLLPLNTSPPFIQVLLSTRISYTATRR